MNKKKEKDLCVSIVIIEIYVTEIALCVKHRKLSSFELDRTGQKRHFIDICKTRPCLELIT